jgi:predicted RNA methylase
MAKAPAAAKGIIYAEYHVDDSDVMTDYFASHSTRTVAIGWRYGTREDFRALRAAAAGFPETAHMADEDTLKAWQVERNGRAWGELEHRENYSMGMGNYLSDHGWGKSGSGWIVKSSTFPCSYVHLTEDAIPDAPAPEAATSAPQRQSTGGKVSTIGEDVLAILRTAETDGPRLRFTARLSRPDYVAVNRVLEAAGGSWSRRERAHVFAGDAGEILAGLLGAGTVERPADNGWFPTPDAVAALVLDAADLAPGLAVLEPSAGEGALAGPAAAAGCAVDCVEQDKGRALKVLDSGYARAVTIADFLNVPPNPVYDRVIMNPPFAKRADVDHVTHAAKFLRPGGLLVAVMGAGVTFRSDKDTEALRDLVTERGGSIEPLANLAFRESGTDVNTVLVTLPAAPTADTGTGATLFSVPA